MKVFFFRCNNFIPCKKYAFQYFSEREYESSIFKKSVRKLLLFFYKEVHPDLTMSLPEELKKINNESLSILNAYIDTLCSSSKEENNIFLEKNLVFFKTFENSENKILKGRYKNIIIKLHSISSNLSVEQKEKITAKLIYDIKKSLEKIKNVNNFDENIDPFDPISNSSNDPIYSEKKKKNDINSIWEDLTEHVKNTEALYQPPEEQIELIQRRKRYFYYIKKKLEAKYQRINHKKRRKNKILKLNQTANKLAQEKFPHYTQKNYDQKIYDQSYKIIHSGYDPNLIFFHKDIKEEEKRRAIENLCGMYFKDDADKWLLENCLKLLKNHQIQIPLVIYSKKEFSLSSTFGFIYVPVDFCLNDFFTFLENNLHQARCIRKKVLKSFDL
ncbi:conserved protein, unknown function [Plasmodium malariae]|uniref:DUF4460 domain-containing protein n=1 Tax=Plasmodium malariae TaxID=5858 RepID=A0A1D3TCL2_PLAMA|nr:conserved protein, unknown function [Plasmodium malariae]SCP02539.1 conserved protein, unknown function [Plasmodium malariae]